MLHLLVLKNGVSRDETLFVLKKKNFCSQGSMQVRQKDVTQVTYGEDCVVFSFT